MLIDHGGALLHGWRPPRWIRVPPPRWSDRSCHKAIGRMFGAFGEIAHDNDRADCARGPSDPSMFSGSPSTKPTTRRSAASAGVLVGVSGEGMRAIVPTPAASLRWNKDAATPIVSSEVEPDREPRGGKCAAASGVAGSMQTSTCWPGQEWRPALARDTQMVNIDCIFIAVLWEICRSDPMRV